ncbi:MAG: HAD-IA family hydrolase [Deltaproteobacteria bacterium]|nr:HAD-IA family hydrolase [Deltaproteobacteria bacterium]MBW2170934.1 HAD-IA family hydrolase [Deltaproteobacteria bacterium]MBW2259008.1 HAD-IA family hydrolase [Deltaproteobacteria bacterium]
MIRAIIFDLDGTLVQTERLKAVSYARAAAELRPGEINEAEVVEAFKEVVGLSRQEVAQRLLEKFELEAAAKPLVAEFGVSATWQAFVQVRLSHYEEMIGDPDVIRSSQWPHNMSLLHEAREAACKVALATMSHCKQVRRVLEILNLTDAFNFVASVDDVQHGKPDPEMYLLVTRELNVAPEECLVIEDSPSGVKAALAAGTWCIAVTTPFTVKALHTEPLLDEKWVVDDPDLLVPTVRDMMAEARGGARQESCVI